MTVQPDLCQTCSQTTLLVFPRGCSNVQNLNQAYPAYFCFSEAKSKPKKSDRLDAAWLQREVAKYFNDASSTALGLSLEDLTSTVFDVLTSPKSDTELQNDVSIGFFHFPFFLKHFALFSNWISSIFRFLFKYPLVLIDLCC